MNESKLEVIQIPIDQLIKFKHQVFKDYEKRRMETLVASVKENGIIHYIVVRRVKEKEGNEHFEIISGHNRVEAARLAGLTKVPAIVKDLTDDAAIILSNEANIESRNFSTWLPSEKIKSINQYHGAVKSQGSKKNSKDTTSGGNRQKSNDSYARERTAAAYGQSNSTIRTFIELDRLIECLMDKLDANDFGTTPASELSFIFREGQEIINFVLDEDNGKDEEKKSYKITVENSKKLRTFFEDGVVKTMIQEDVESVKQEIRNILSRPKDNVTCKVEADVTITIKILTDDYRELFPGEPTQEEVAEAIIEMIKAWKNNEVTQSTSDGGDVV